MINMNWSINANDSSSSSSNISNNNVMDMDMDMDNVNEKETVGSVYKDWKRRKFFNLSFNNWKRNDRKRQRERKKKQINYVGRVRRKISARVTFKLAPLGVITLHEY